MNLVARYCANHLALLAALLFTSGSTLLAASTVFATPAPQDPTTEKTATSIQEPQVKATPETRPETAPDEVQVSSNSTPKETEALEEVEEVAVEDLALELPNPNLAVNNLLTDAPNSQYDQYRRQIEFKEFQPVIDSLEIEIDDIERRHHRYHTDLVEPITLLGDAHTGKGQHAQALVHFQRATHLERISSGLSALSQLPIVYREADALKKLGSYQEANNREEYALQILRRNHAQYDPALIPGMTRLARWYLQTNNILRARQTYDFVVHIYEASGNPNDPAAIEPLQGIAQTYRLERFPSFYLESVNDPRAAPQVTPEGFGGRGEYDPQPVLLNNFPAGQRALQRIVEIERAQPEPDPAAISTALVDLADWHLLFDRYRQAGLFYQSAYEQHALAETDAAEKFAEPHVLYFPAPADPKPPPMRNRGPQAQGFVEVSYRVTHKGEVSNLQTVESQPKNMMDFRVRRSLRATRYRPVLVDGVAVSKEHHTYRHEFVYYPRVSSETTAASTSNRKPPVQATDSNESRSTNGEPAQGPKSEPKVESETELVEESEA